jgi:hypothetical protein
MLDMDQKLNKGIVYAILNVISLRKLILLH